MTAHSLLLTAATCLCFAVGVPALQWPGVAPTPAVEAQLAEYGQSPRPTDAPRVEIPMMNILGKRQLGWHTCGFQDAIFSSSITCDTGFVCATDPYYKLAGCCDPGNLDGCGLPTTCIDSGSSTSCGASCENNAQIQICTGTSSEAFCYTLTHFYNGQAFNEYGCDTASYDYSIFDTYAGESSAGLASFPVAAIPVPSGATLSSIPMTAAITVTPPATSSSNSTSTDNGGSSSGGSSTSTGAIVGGIVGGCAFLAVAAIVITILILRSRRSRNRAAYNSIQQSGPSAPDGLSPTGPATPMQQFLPYNAQQRQMQDQDFRRGPDPVQGSGYATPQIHEVTATQRAFEAEGIGKFEADGRGKFDAPIGVQELAANDK